MYVDITMRAAKENDAVTAEQYNRESIRIARATRRSEQCQVLERATGVRSCSKNLRTRATQTGLSLPGAEVYKLVSLVWAFERK